MLDSTRGRATEMHGTFPAIFPIFAFGPGLLRFAIKSVNSTFGPFIWWDACTSFDTWLHLLRGILSKLLTLRFHCDYLSLQNTNSQYKSVTHFALFQVFRGKTCCILYKLIPVKQVQCCVLIMLYSNALGLFDMIEPFDKYATRFEITCTWRPVI